MTARAAATGTGHPGSATPSSSGTGFCRVTVVAPDSRIDVALPEDIPLADLYPEILRLSGQSPAEGAPVGYHLVRRDGTVLDSTRSLAAQRILDGELLSLRPFSESLPPAVFDDVSDAVASAVDPRPHPVERRPDARRRPLRRLGPARPAGLRAVDGRPAARHARPAGHPGRRHRCPAARARLRTGPGLRRPRLGRRPRPRRDGERRRRRLRTAAPGRRTGHRQAPVPARLRRRPGRRGAPHHRRPRR